MKTDRRNELFVTRRASRRLGHRNTIFQFISASKNVLSTFDPYIDIQHPHFDPDGDHMGVTETSPSSGRLNFTDISLFNGKETPPIREFSHWNRRLMLIRSKYSITLCDIFTGSGRYMVLMNKGLPLMPIFRLKNTCWQSHFEPSASIAMVPEPQKGSRGFGLNSSLQFAEALMLDFLEVRLFPCWVLQPVDRDDPCVLE